jgi:MFS family permease
MLLLLQLLGGMMLAPQRTFLPIYLKELGYSAIGISALAAARQAAGLVASLVGGSLSDRLGRKWTILAGEAGFLLGSLAFLASQQRWIAPLWAASGFGLGLHTLGGQSYLVDVAQSGSLGVWSALYNWGYTLGGALSSPIVGFLLDRGDYRVFGATCAGLALATMTANALALPQTRVPRIESAEARNPLFGYAGIATRSPVIVLALLRFLPTLYWGMALVLIPLLLDASGATKTAIALYATISQMIAALAQLATGRAADALGPEHPTIAVLAALVASILGIAAYPRQQLALLAFGTVSTAAAWSLSTLLPLWTARVTAPQERGRVLGWVHLWWNAAMIAGSMAAGPLLKQWTSLPFVVAGTLNLGTIALALVFFCRKDWKTSELQDHIQPPSPSRAS